MPARSVIECYFVYLGSWRAGELLLLLLRLPNGDVNERRAAGRQLRSARQIIEHHMAPLHLLLDRRRILVELGISGSKSAARNERLSEQARERLGESETGRHSSSETSAAAPSRSSSGPVQVRGPLTAACNSSHGGRGKALSLFNDLS